jgi:hypothetical protein
MKALNNYILTSKIQEAETDIWAARAYQEAKFVALDENPCSWQQNPDSSSRQQSLAGHQKSTKYGHDSGQGTSLARYWQAYY